MSEACAVGRPTESPCSASRERGPPEPLPASPVQEFAFQALAVLALALGGNYLAWRWSETLNPDALAFSIGIAAAETLAFAGAVLFFLSLWRTEDPPRRAPPRTVREIGGARGAGDRPVRVDVLVTTLDEPVSLVRRSVRDAKRLVYPHAIALRVHVLDDGRRPAMRAMARAEGVGYLARGTNEGYKAGNLKHGLEHTDGDLVVICDADTRLFPRFLEETLGYFRDPRVAWVQTPQWFDDIDPGVPLPEWLARRARLGRAGRRLGRAVERLLGPVAIGADPLGVDPRAFYDVVQRRRNWCNAAFCCGAGSVHRREAVMEAAVKQFGATVASAVRRYTERVAEPGLRAALGPALAQVAARHVELTPYKFHVSEDIYTSIVLHADPDRRWRSVYHPRVLARMVSPQHLLAWTIQRFKYAGGTLDIACHDNPLRLRGLTAWQKLMYAATIYGYFAPLWTVPLLAAPLVFFFAGVTPVRAFDAPFYAHLVPFLVASRLAFMAGTWGVATWRGEQYHLAAFWLNLKALASVLAGRPIRFRVTPKSRSGRRSVGLVLPHLALLAAMGLGVLWGGLRVLGGHAPGQAGAYAANLFWTMHNASCLLPILLAAFRSRRGAAP